MLDTIETLNRGGYNLINLAQEALWPDSSAV